MELLCKPVDAVSFLSILPKYWNSVFLEEYSLYKKTAVLYGLYRDNSIIGGVWIGYNPDSFKDNTILNGIDTLYKNNIEKISYFFILPEHQNQGYGRYFMNEILQIHPKSFLTCTGEKLKSFYNAIGFQVMKSEGDKYIMTYGYANDTIFY